MFNIKANSFWTGKKGVKRVHEYTNGVKIFIDSFFRVYDSPCDSFFDYADYILNRKTKDGKLRYEKAIECKSICTAYIIEIANAGYATDPDYASKVSSISKYMALTQV